MSVLISHINKLFARCLIGHLFCCRAGLRIGLLIALVTVATTTSQGQTTDTTSSIAEQPNATTDQALDQHVRMGRAYEGTTDSLMAIVRNSTNYTLAYSSRTYHNMRTKLAVAHPTLRQCLDAIFCRYPVHYVVRGNKIVVVADEITMCRISGFCKDATTGEALIGAHISDTLLHRVVATNERGFFSLSVPSGRMPIMASYVGYNAQVRTMAITTDTTINFLLPPRLLLDEVTIQSPERLTTDELRTGATDLPTNQMKSLPSLLGESDILRALQQTPGVQSGAEGYGGMSVRGGSSDQNMVFVDGAPLYNPNHMLGLFSAISAEAINKATLIKGGFPAQYGGHMSSVLDIHTRDGNSNHLSGNANIGLMASNIEMDGPIVPDKASFIITARRTYFDMAAGLIQKDNDEKYYYYFYDITAKLNWQVSAKDRLSVSFFTARDELSRQNDTETVQLNYGTDKPRSLTSHDVSETQWGDLLTSANWSHVYAANVYGSTTGWFSRYKFASNQTSDNTSADIARTGYGNGIYDTGLRTDVSIYTTRIPTTIRTGIMASYKTYKPALRINTASREDSTHTAAQNDVRLHRTETHAYVEDELRIGPIFAIGGVHASLLWRSDSRPFVSIEPRILAGWHPNKVFLAKVGLSKTSQFVYQARLLSIASPADIWLPVPNDKRPQSATQISVETVLNLPGDVRLTIEGYHKKYKHQRTYTSLSPYELMAQETWTNSCTEGTGYANGLEFFLHRRRGRFSGWAGYAISTSRNKFPEINRGEEFPSDNDRLHNINLFARWSASERIDISATWNYKTGTPFTLPTQHYVVPTTSGDMELMVPAERNALRLPASHQLSVGVDIKYGQERRGSVLSFGVMNAYANANPMFVYWRQNEEGQYKLKQFSLMTFPWPYVKYSIHF